MTPKIWLAKNNIINVERIAKTNKNKETKIVNRIKSGLFRRRWLEWKRDVAKDHHFSIKMYFYYVIFSHVQVFDK